MQVTAAEAGEAGAFGDTIEDEAGDFRPTLGPTWHHCVTTRLVMSNVAAARSARAAAGTGAGGDEEGDGDGVGGEFTFPGISKGAGRLPWELQSLTKVVELTKSPIAPRERVCFVIGARGLVGI